VDSEELYPMDRGAARDELGWPRDRYIALQLGRMVPRKGIETVVRAVALCNRTFSENVDLYVVGGNSDDPNALATPEIGRLSEIARESGVEDRVTFLGRRGRAKLRLYYSAADVFVTTPWYEPFGITPLEAMACETPVIGADVGGIRYSVADRESGLLVPPKDPAAVAQCLTMLKRDSDYATRLGAAGLARVREMFTWSGVAGALADVYARVAGVESSAALRVADGTRA
jgi:glycosyltransferase involved in cell wall biosynthesis